MRTKILGRTGIKLPIIGLGTCGVGISSRKLFIKQYKSGSKHENVYMDENIGIKTIIAAIEAGATFIDTAPWYGCGKSEMIIARTFAERPDLKKLCLVTTKVGHMSLNDAFDFSYDAVMRSIEESQKRLKQETFPILYLHDPMGEDMKFVMSSRGAVGALHKLKEQGVTQAIGIAANDPETNADYIETGEFDVAEVAQAWSLINKTAARRIFPAAVKFNVGIVVATPIERGLLVTGPVKNAKYLDRPSGFPRKCLGQVAKIKELCTEFNIPLVAAALQWCVRHPQATTVIPGAQNPKQAIENTISGICEIPREFWEKAEILIGGCDFPINQF